MYNTDILLPLYSLNSILFQLCFTLKLKNRFSRFGAECLLRLLFVFFSLLIIFFDTGTEFDVYNLKIIKYRFETVRRWLLF